MDFERLREIIKYHAKEKFLPSSGRIKGWSNRPGSDIYVHYSGSGLWNEWGVNGNELSYWDDEGYWISYKGNGINKHTIHNNNYLTWLWEKLSEKE